MIRDTYDLAIGGLIGLCIGFVVFVIIPWMVVR